MRIGKLAYSVGRNESEILKNLGSRHRVAADNVFAAIFDFSQDFFFAGRFLL